MANSYRKIDYRLRPAKAVERRMIAEYFQRLRAFSPVENYRYIGLGSVYFSDFSLYHNICGFKEMISIEDTEDPKIKERFSFNSPLGTIQLQFGTTNTILPKLNWEQKTVTWLDFDGPLDSSVLTDISFLCAKIAPESAIFVTVNGELADDEEGMLGKLEVLQKRIGIEKIPAALQSKTTIGAREIASLYQEIFSNEVKSALIGRNAGKNKSEHFCAEQVAFFRYADGVIMYTIGWVTFLEKDRSKFNHCAFNELTHSSTEKVPFSIEIPLMTNAEIREINKCKVMDNKFSAKHIPIPESEIKKYTSLKRFWPVLQIPEMT